MKYGIMRLVLGGHQSLLSVLPVETGKRDSVLGCEA